MPTRPPPAPAPAPVTSDLPLLTAIDSSAASSPAFRSSAICSRLGLRRSSAGPCRRTQRQRSPWVAYTPDRGVDRQQMLHVDAEVFRVPDQIRPACSWRSRPPGGIVPWRRSGHGCHRRTVTSGSDRPASCFWPSSTASRTRRTRDFEMRPAAVRPKPPVEQFRAIPCSSNTSRRPVAVVQPSGATRGSCSRAGPMNTW